MRGARARDFAVARSLAIAAACFALLLSGCPKKPPAPAPAPPAPAPAPAPAPTWIEPSACKRVERLDVRKRERALFATCAGGGQMRFPIALARGRGAKRVRGDEKMPEGDYRIAGPARKSGRFHLFIPIDYPSRADADRALAAGLIGKGEHAAIAKAHAKRRMPPQDTALGGALGIHGEGPRWRGDLDLDWTQGCVAVSDAAIEQLARLVRVGTPLHIAP
ncbi:MAG: hypothetical protein DCC71_09130 [Proteobacteria bacterium]|nr:MAG: hypothetical protein DCC71_09130 [Pseudomonadota bacterium]